MKKKQKIKNEEEEEEKEEGKEEEEEQILRALNAFNKQDDILRLHSAWKPVLYMCNISVMTMTLIVICIKRNYCSFDRLQQ